MTATIDSKYNQKIMAATGVIILLVVNYFQRFKLYSFEADHLFLFDADWITGHLCEVGGINLLITSFVTQFFKFPLVGAIIATAIYLIIFICIKKLISNVIHTKEQEALIMIPIGLLMICIEEQYYSFRGHMAVAICMIVMVLYQQFTNKYEKYNLIAAVISTLLLYFVAGSVATLFAVSILAIDILQNKKPINGIAAVATLFVCGFVSYLLGAFVSFAEAILPMQYYTWPTSISFSISAWLSVPLIAIASKSIHNQRFNIVIIAASVLGFCFEMHEKHDLKDYKMLQEWYLANNENWDKIVKVNCRKNVETNFISYANLALAKQGQLLDRMFEFNQQLPTQVTNSRTVSNETLRLDNIVYFHIGHLALARKYAYNSVQITPGFIEPHDFTRIIAINNAIGFHEVSKKYSRVLHKTMFYSDMPQKDGIANFSAHPPLNSNFSEMFGFAHDCREIIAANPKNTVAQQFLIAYILLTADKNGLIEYLTDHQGQPMHRRVEEACTIMFSTEECRQYGVSEKVITEFEALKKGIGINDFHKTYWYYIAYLKNKFNRI
jgi:hypothetical protein